MSDADAMLACMAYDQALVERIRPLLEAHEPVDERRMFGGLAFIVGGHMAVCVSSQGGLMVRVREDERDALIVLDGAGEMIMSGRPSRTWLRVQGSVLDDDATLAEWVERAVDTVDDLPPKA